MGVIGLLERSFHSIQDNMDERISISKLSHLILTLRLIYLFILPFRKLIRGGSLILVTLSFVWDIIKSFCYNLSMHT